MCDHKYHRGYEKANMTKLYLSHMAHTTSSSYYTVRSKHIFYDLTFYQLSYYIYIIYDVCAVACVESCRVHNYFEAPFHASAKARCVSRHFSNFPSLSAKHSLKFWNCSILSNFLNLMVWEQKDSVKVSKHGRRKARRWGEETWAKRREVLTQTKHTLSLALLLSNNLQDLRSWICTVKTPDFPSCTSSRSRC